MTMKMPPHPGQGLRDDIEALGLSISDAAKALKVTRQQLHNVISGRSAISAEMAIKLEMGIGGRAEAWLRLQAAHDLAVIRQRGNETAITRIPSRTPST